ncbi:hypothetical protein [Saccharibacillus kuerlensis]|uniref:Uncharacterized protein n=1 Tax=Saccharibacillus kuerlensis TaxID=459527 RepID=A0ABQ2KRS7_9BACL|nr:hypothetical protein [Saccharibacillus kuerlensis]GGN91091.1 hypothetical protein GCM10010969_02320 [Saccharibacillus kuerlensis]
MTDQNQDPNQQSAGEDTLMEKERKEKGANVETQADEWANDTSPKADGDTDGK